MRKNYLFVIITVVLSLLITSCRCSRGSISIENKQPDSMAIQLRPDTIVFCTLNFEEMDSVLDELQKIRDSLIAAKDSMVYYRDSVEYINYINARRIEKIKYYIDICNKRSLNKKYFFGWVKRTMSEE